MVRGGRGREAASAYYRTLIYVNFFCFSFLGYFADLPLYVFSTVHNIFCVLPYYIYVGSHVKVYSALGLHYYTR